MCPPFLTTMSCDLGFKVVKGLHFCHFNVRSIFNDMSDIRDYFIDSDIHCVTFSETWLDGGVPDNHVHIEGYSLQRLDRQIHDDGDINHGGLLTYTKDGLTCTNELFTHNVSNKDIEIMWTVISKFNMRRIVIANIYLPPKGNDCSYSPQHHTGFF